MKHCFRRKQHYPNRIECHLNKHNNFFFIFNAITLERSLDAIDFLSFFSVSLGAERYCFIIVQCGFLFVCGHFKQTVFNARRPIAFVFLLLFSSSSSSFPISAFSHSIVMVWCISMQALIHLDNGILNEIQEKSTKPTRPNKFRMKKQQKLSVCNE